MNFVQVSQPKARFNNSTCDCRGICRGDCERDELNGFFSKIGKGFKKVGKVVAKSGIISAIPVVGTFAQMGIDAASSFSSNPDLEKKCAKKPNDKKCRPYLEQKRAAEQQQQAAQAAQTAQAEQAKADREQQQAFQTKQLEILTKLAAQPEKPQNAVSSLSSVSSAFAGIDQTTLLIGSAAVAAGLFFASRR